MEGAHKRTDRVNQLLQKELGDLLVNGVMDPRVGFVTVTEVRCSPDLRSARVFVSVYGSDEEQAHTLDGLRDAAGFLRRELGRRVRLRYVPEISFNQDNTLDQAQRLEELLHAAQTGAVQAPEATPQELAPVRTSRSERAERAEGLAKARAARRREQRSSRSSRSPRARKKRG